MMIPPQSSRCYHFNFPDEFIDAAVWPLLDKLQDMLDRIDQGASIVINLEKCRWFELFPLGVLVTMLLGARQTHLSLHVVLPSGDVLPFLHPYLKKLRGELASSPPNEEAERISRRIQRHEKVLPHARLLAGSFLMSWGVLDALDAAVESCRWYLARTKEVSFDELRQQYLFHYGGRSTAESIGADRIWPFTVVMRSEAREAMRRLNGEELIAGALRRYASARLIADGVAANVLVFEPFDNVFQHAFPDPRPSDFGLLGMRLRTFDTEQQGPGGARARWESRMLPDWLRPRVLESPTKTWLEIVVGDPGVGIPVSLSVEFRNDVAPQSSLNRAAPPHGSHEERQEILRYAFSPSSTRVGRTSRPGRRGLFWVAETLAREGGLVEIRSGGAWLALAGEAATSLPLLNSSAATPAKPTEESVSVVRGTYLRVLVPLDTTKAGHGPSRLPTWGPPRVTVDLLTPTTPAITTVVPPSALFSWGALESSWSQFVAATAVTATLKPDSLIAIDLLREPVSRTSLEYLISLVCRDQNLRGRTIVFNCDRQVVCRLDTLTASLQLREVHVVLPFFDIGLRSYWCGADGDEEAQLLQSFSGSPLPDALRPVGEASPGLFAKTPDGKYFLRIGARDLEPLVRDALGQRLWRSLEERGAIHHGRYRLPLSDHSVSTYIEPHHLFGDPRIADAIGEHLALLFRRRYSAPGRASPSEDFRVLTATRIGRDIAMRMPAAYPARAFVYHDYHLLKPGKHRVLKLVAGCRVVVLVDVVTTGGQVEKLIEACAQAQAEVVGVVSMIDFSPGGGQSRIFRTATGSSVEHLTFVRQPQDILSPSPGDTAVDSRTLSLSPLFDVPEDEHRPSHTELSSWQGIRFLEDSGIVHFGHFELYGHHYDCFVSVEQLLTLPSPHRDEVLRAVTSASTRRRPGEVPTAIVLYPDLSAANVLHAAMERQRVISNLVRDGALRFVEARRSASARGVHYWLTADEVRAHREWALARYPDGFAVAVLDDGSVSGLTLLALLRLASQLAPQHIRSVTVVERLPHLLSDHLRDIDSFVWAKSVYRAFLHLSIPGYDPANCPLCRERSALLRERRAACRDWCVKFMDDRLADLEVTTALSPSDMASDRYARATSVPSFKWEDPILVPGPRQTVGTRLLAVRHAIGEGVPLDRILTEVSSQADNELFEFVTREIGRRVDIQVAQACESKIRDGFISILAGRNAERRASALAALGLMRAEVLAPALSAIVKASIEGPLDREVSGYLVVLIRRVISYRHLPLADAVQLEVEVRALLADACARVGAESPRHEQIMDLQVELSDQVARSASLPEVVRGLERILCTQRRPEHHFLSELGRYISDGRSTVDPGAIAAVDRAVAGTHYAGLLVIQLDKTQSLAVPEEFRRAVEALRRESQELSGLARGHMHRTRVVRSTHLRDALDDMLRDFAPCASVVTQHCCDLGRILSTELERWRAGFHNDYPHVRTSVTIPPDTPASLGVVSSAAVAAQVVTNLLMNLRHSIANDGSLAAVLTLVPGGSSKVPTAVLRVSCETMASPTDGQAKQIDATMEVVQDDAATYGVERRVEDTSPWIEEWTFWRLR